MPGPTPRTRVIFQNCNVFVGPAGQSGNTATGQLYSSGNSGFNLIGQLSRIQSANLNVQFNRTDIYELGQLQRIDSPILAPPTFTMDFNYFVTDGQNENVLGFTAKGGASFISGILTKTSDSKNYFISYSPQGQDDDGWTNQYQRDVIGLGNGFISNYTINAAVGQPATASVTVEGLNVDSFTGSSGNQTPAVDPISNNRVTQWNWQLPVGSPITGVNTVSVLKPGDVVLSIPTAAGFFTPLSGSFGVNVQSLSVGIPISREIINKLGSPFGISREIQFPLNCTISINALQTDLQQAGFDTLLCNDSPSNFQITFKQPACNGTGANAVVLNVNQAFLVGQTINNSIGSDSSLSLSYTAQVAGALSTAGIVFSGYGVS